MLAYPLHLNLSSTDDCDVTVLDDFKHRSIDGDLVGVVGGSWVLKPDPVSVTWHSIKGVKEGANGGIVTAPTKDVEGLNSLAITTTSSYFYGKLVAKAARLALIVEGVCFLDVFPAIRKFLKSTIDPWLDGTFDANGFLYDEGWIGIEPILARANFGFGFYSDHDYHLCYFLFGIAVLAKIDPARGTKYKPQAHSLMADFVNLGRRLNSNYP